MTELEEFPFAVFAGHRYYPEGGAGDFRDSFTNIESARAWVELSAEEIRAGDVFDIWAQIVDRKDMKILMSAGNRGNGWQWEEKE